MPNLATLIALLRDIRAGSSRGRNIKAFQSIVWGDADLDVDPVAERLLRELAHDLDFYEPDAERRQEDPAYFGDGRLEDEVGRVLAHFGG